MYALWKLPAAAFYYEIARSKDNGQYSQQDPPTHTHTHVSRHRAVVGQALLAFVQGQAEQAVRNLH